MIYTPENTSIAVMGSGNIGTQFSCVCAAKGYKVNLFSSRPEMFDGVLEVVDEFGNVTTGKLNKVASNVREAMDQCRVIFIAYPAFKLKDIADQLLPYMHNGIHICVLPGTGGAEFAFRRCINAGGSLYGLQRVPTVARLEQYGKRVRCEGLRPELFLASISKESAQDFAMFLCELWDIPCNVLPNYLCVTLTPSNPILHTTRLYTLFSDYKQGKKYTRNILFYGEWDDASSELLLACDAELQDMLSIMPGLDLQSVKSLKLHYGSDTPEAMTRKLRSIKSLQNLASPMKLLDRSWVPDFQSRFFTADFPYGLAIIEEFARVLGYQAPNIEKVMSWYRKITGDTSRFDLGKHGIHDLQDIYTFYSRSCWAKKDGI